MIGLQTHKELGHPPLSINIVLHVEADKVSAAVRSQLKWKWGRELSASAKFGLLQTHPVAVCSNQPPNEAVFILAALLAHDNFVGGLTRTAGRAQHNRDDNEYTYTAYQRRNEISIIEDKHTPFSVQLWKCIVMYIE